MTGKSNGWETKSPEESENRRNCLETHQSPKSFPGRSRMANPQNASGRSPFTFYPVTFHTPPLALLQLNHF